MGGVWGHHLPLLFRGLVLVQCCRGCGAVAAMSAVPALASGQIWPQPMHGQCLSGAVPGGVVGGDDEVLSNFNCFCHGFQCGCDESDGAVLL
jgi:hypothetical protein